MQIHLVALRVGRPHILHEVCRNCRVNKQFMPGNKGKQCRDCGLLPKMCSLVLASQVYTQLMEKMFFLM